MPASSPLEADRLASFALDAATQLDRFKRGRNGDLEPIRQFSEAMARFTGLDSDAGAGAQFLDPASTDFLSSAVGHVTNRSISNVETLNEELRQVIAQLADAPRDERTIDSFKCFCLAIHSCILKARDSAGLHERGVFDYDHSFTG